MQWFSSRFPLLHPFVSIFVVNFFFVRSIFVTFKLSLNSDMSTQDCGVVDLRYMKLAFDLIVVSFAPAFIREMNSLPSSSPMLIPEENRPDGRLDALDSLRSLF